jgi:predicted nucleic acid-binding protein
VNVLVDTSVWSLLFRKGGPADHRQVGKLLDLLASQQQVALTGSILQEVLQAFRSEQKVSDMVDHFTPFPLLPLERDTCIDAATLFRRCAAKGGVVSTIDCQIAAVALHHDYALLTADSDFSRIASVSDLVLL